MNHVEPNTTRRRLLAGALGAAALAPVASLSFAGSSAGRSDRRFVLVILRGGLDGLSAVPAIGDPDFAAARGPLAQFAAPPLALPGTPFALHPQLAQLHAMYGRGELADGLDHRHRDQGPGLGVVGGGLDLLDEREAAEGALGRDLDHVAADAGVDHDHEARAVEADPGERGRGADVDVLRVAHSTLAHAAIE